MNHNIELTTIDALLIIHGLNEKNFENEVDKKNVANIKKKIFDTVGNDLNNKKGE